MNSVQNEGGQRYGILVWFEGVYQDDGDNEKGDDDIGDVYVNNYVDNDDDNNDDDHDHDHDNNDDDYTSKRQHQ